MCYLCPVLKRLVSQAGSKPCAYAVTFAGVNTTPTLRIRTFSTASVISRLAPQPIIALQQEAVRTKDEIVEDPELRKLRVSKDADTIRLGEIIKQRILNNRPTLVAAAGQGAVSQTVKAFRQANRPAFRKKSFLDLTVSEAIKLRESVMNTSDFMVKGAGLALSEGAKVYDIVKATQGRPEGASSDLIPLSVPVEERRSLLQKKLQNLESIVEASASDSHPIRCLYFEQEIASTGYVGFIPQRETVKMKSDVINEGFQTPFEPMVVLHRFEPVTISAVPEDQQRVYHFSPGKKEISKQEMGELADKLAEMWVEHLTNGRPEPRPRAIGKDATYRMLEILSMAINRLEKHHDGKIFACIVDAKEFSEARAYYPEKAANKKEAEKAPKKEAEKAVNKQKGEKAAKKAKFTRSVTRDDGTEQTATWGNEFRLFAV